MHRDPYAVDESISKSAQEDKPKIEVKKEPTKSCKNCAELNPLIATDCRRCGEDFPIHTDSTSTESKSNSQSEQPFKSPILSDWIFYLWVFSLISIYPLTFGKHYGLPAELIDFALGVAVQSVLFLWLPATVRRNLRGKR